MNKLSVLSEIISLFDGAEKKVCPILGTDSLLTPATFVRVSSAERDTVTGTLKVVFELKHRYRDVDPSDGTEAFTYLEHLVGVAEDTGNAAVLSLEGGGTPSKGSVAECCAKMEYVCKGRRVFSLLTSDGDMSSYVDKITLKHGGVIRSRNYIYDASPVRDMVGNDVRLSIRCTADGAAYIKKYFGSIKKELTAVIGNIVLRGSFILGEISVSDTFYCELLSSGKVEYGSFNYDTGEFEAESERSDL